MKPLRSVPPLFVGLLLASACAGGLQSRVCVEYFEQAEQCAAPRVQARDPAARARGRDGHGGSARGEEVTDAHGTDRGAADNPRPA